MAKRLGTDHQRAQRKIGRALKVINDFYAAETTPERYPPSLCSDCDRVRQLFRWQSCLNLCKACTAIRQATFDRLQAEDARADN